MPFLSIAHRGASEYAPENTFAAFEKALDLNFDYIELDIRLTKDHRLVVIHDGDVSRTTNGEGFVKDLTYEYLKTLDAGSWFSPEFAGESIPLLRDVLNRYGGKIGLLVEMKAPENNPAMVELLSRLIKDTIESGVNPASIKVQSFHANEIKRFKELTPEIETGIVLSKSLTLFNLSAYRKFASFLSVHHVLLSKSFVKQANFFGFNIYSWTISNYLDLYEMQRLGVHGIISNKGLKNEPDKNVEDPRS